MPETVAARCSGLSPASRQDERLGLAAQTLHIDVRLPGTLPGFRPGLPLLDPARRLLKPLPRFLPMLQPLVRHRQKEKVVGGAAGLCGDGLVEALDRGFEAAGAIERGAEGIQVVAGAVRGD